MFEYLTTINLLRLLGLLFLLVCCIASTRWLWNYLFPEYWYLCRLLSPNTKIRREAEKAVFALEVSQDRIFTRYLNGLQSADTEVRLNCIRYLATYRRTEAVDALITRLGRSSNGAETIAILQALSKLGEVRAKPAIEEVLRNEPSSFEQGDGNGRPRHIDGAAMSYGDFWYGVDVEGTVCASNPVYEAASSALAALSDHERAP